MGHLEPAGCDQDMGGLGRHATLIRSLQQKHPQLINLHTGNIIDIPEINSELTYQIAISALSYMGYKLICVGPNDLALSPIKSIQSNYPSLAVVLSLCDAYLAKKGKVKEMKLKLSEMMWIKNQFPMYWMDN